MTHSGKTYVTVAGIMQLLASCLTYDYYFYCKLVFGTPTFKVRAKCEPEEPASSEFLHCLQFPAAATVGQSWGNWAIPHLAATKIKTGGTAAGFPAATLARFPDFPRSAEARSANEAANRSPPAEIVSVSSRALVCGGVAGCKAAVGDAFVLPDMLPKPRN